MALINFYKGLESNYDSSLHNNSIYQCTDSGVVYILGIKHEKISKEEIDNIVGTNTYTDANYISKETNLTDAALQLDEEIKATNDNLALMETNLEANYLPLSGGTLSGNLTADKGFRAHDAYGHNLIFSNAQSEDDGEIWVGSLSCRTIIESSDPVLRRTGSDSSTNVMILDTSMKGTNYLAPNGVTIADINNLGNNWSSVLANNVQSKNFTVNGSDRSVFGPSTETFSIYAPSDAGTSGLFLKSTGSVPSWNNIEISDITNLLTTLDNKISLTGDSFKNNNVCWGGKTTDGDNVCLAFVDPNNNNKFGSWTGGTYIRSNSPQTLMLEVGTVGESDSTFYDIYNEGNFKAGVDYVAPSALNSYLPLSGGTITGPITFDSTIDAPIKWGNNGILYKDSNGIFFGTQNELLLLRTNDNPVALVRNHDTYYLWDSYNFDPEQWYISQQTEDYNLTSKNGITYFNNNITNVDNNPGGRYGVVATIGNLNNSNIGTADTWGFQLGRSNDNDYLKYREFTGLSIGDWKELATRDDNKALIIEESSSANTNNALAYARIKEGNYNVVWRDSATQIYIANSISILESSIEFNYTMFVSTGYTSYKVTLLEDGTCTKAVYVLFTIPTVQTVSEFPTELDNYADGSIFIKE